MFDFIRPIFKNLFHRPSTRNHPFEKREPFAGARGHIEGINVKECVFCGICEKKCPANAIKVNRQERTWEIDQYKCVICNVCVEVCPKKCINMNPSYLSPGYEMKLKVQKGDAVIKKEIPKTQE